MDHVVVKNKIKAEIDVNPFTSDTKFYKFVFKIIKEKNATDNFLLSEGFTSGEILKIKRILALSKSIDFSIFQK